MTLPFSSETSLPFQNEKVAELPEQEDSNLIETESTQIDFSSAFINQAKATLNRFVFHVKAFLGGLTAQILKLFLPKSSFDPFYGITFLANYLGIVMLFPGKTNRLALGLGIIIAVLMVGIGFWPIALLVGGLFSTLFDMADRKMENGAAWITIPLALITLYLATIGHKGSFFSILPTWALGTSVGLTIAFFIFKTQLRPLMHRLFMNEDERRRFREEMTKLKEQAREAHNLSQRRNRYAIFERHLELLRLIEAEMKKIQNPIANQIQVIGERSMAIIKCMDDDPRDVIVGGQFLNRYLPMIHQSIVRYNVISELNEVENKNEIYEKTLRSLNGMKQAFIQMHQQLIDNDVEDLKIDLNVMDKLIKSQGFFIDDE